MCCLVDQLKFSTLETVRDWPVSVFDYTDEVIVVRLHVMIILQTTLQLLFMLELNFGNCPKFQATNYKNSVSWALVSVPKVTGVILIRAAMYFASFHFCSSLYSKQGSKLPKSSLLYPDHMNIGSCWPRLHMEFETESATDWGESGKIKQVLNVLFVDIPSHKT
jgi:hypothetical protein